MQEIDIASGSPPVARRSDSMSRFDLIFEGTRNANVRDRHTRVRISLPIPLATQLWRQLDEQLEDSEKTIGAVDH